MKIVRFFSKVAIICNICFVIFAILGMLESSGSDNHAPDIVNRLSFVKDIIITLGFLAIVVNLIMCLVYLVLLSTGKKELIPKKIAMINAAFLIGQILYYFI